jgi:hypothetical protein
VANANVISEDARKRMRVNRLR